MSEFPGNSDDEEVIDQTEILIRFKRPFFEGHVIVTEYVDEPPFKVYSDGTQASYSEDGSVFTRFPRRLSVIEHSDGRVEEIMY